MGAAAGCPPAPRWTALGTNAGRAGLSLCPACTHALPLHDPYAEPRVWVSERMVLQVRADPATRKCAFAALLQALPPGAAERRPWAAFLALWDLFLQFPLHIIQAPFLKLVEQLRGERADFQPGLSNTGYAHVLQAPQLIQQGNCTFTEARWRRMRLADAPFTPAWEAVIWTAGFQHDNSQVRSQE